MFSADFSSQAKKFLKKTDKQLARRLIEKIEKLSEDPFPPDAKRVVNRKEKIFRVRVGDYRIQFIVIYERNLVFITEIEKRSYITPGSLQLHVLKDDPDDNMVLACAVEGYASHLVTGNQKHFPFISYQGVTIVTPRNFIDILEAHKS